MENIKENIRENSIKQIKLALHLLNFNDIEIERISEFIKFEGRFKDLNFYK